jgi:hypothetical protein
MTVSAVKTEAQDAARWRSRWRRASRFRESPQSAHEERTMSVPSTILTPVAVTKGERRRRS